MFGSMVGMQSEAAEIRRGIKKIDRKKSQGKNIMSASAKQGGHNKTKSDIFEMNFYAHIISSGVIRSLFVNLPVFASAVYDHV